MSVVYELDRKVEETEQKNNGYAYTLREFCSNTSISALPNATRSENKVNRIFWSISFLAFLGLMLYFIIRVLQVYFDYPASMNSDVIQQQPEYFPAFSFCNVGKLRYDQFINSFLNYTNTNNLTDSNDTTTITRAQSMYVTNFLIEQINQNKSLEQYFFPLSSMLYQCSFNSQPCSADDFISFKTSDYGSCYTINAKLKNSSARMPRYAILGSAGLHLGLYVHSQQYVPYVMDGIGIIGLMHNNVQAPLIDLQGLYLAPGYKYRMSYTKAITNYLGSPYTECTNDVSQSMQAVLNNYPDGDYTYSQVLCIQNNLQIYTYQICGCINPNTWDKRSIVLPGTGNIIIAPLCNVTSTCYTQAAYTFLTGSTSSSNSAYSCPKKCSSTEFSMRKSELSAPVDWQMNDIKSFVENSSVRLPANWSLIWRDSIRANYLSINIICETNSFAVNQQQALFGVNTLISNVGGQASLWLGIGVLAIVELAELSFRLVRISCQKIRSKIQRNK